MSRNFKQALKEISDACKFELWLRFFFVVQDNEQLKISIPEQDLQHIRNNYPELSPLADKLNAQFITPEKSQKILVDFISHHLDGKKMDHSMVPSILNSKSFEVEMTAFHMWVEAHEQQLENDLQDFEDWMQSFEAWKRTEKGQNMLSTLGNVQQEHSTTQ